MHLLSSLSKSWPAEAALFGFADDKDIVGSDLKPPPIGMRWPHMHADQVRGLSLREIGGGFARHHRAPSIRAACYVIVKPSTMVQKMQNIKRLRGHRNAVYCGMLFTCLGVNLNIIFLF